MLKYLQIITLLSFSLLAQKRVETVYFFDKYDLDEQQQKKHLRFYDKGRHFNRIHSNIWLL
jgi:hypothetical protein